MNEIAKHKASVEDADTQSKVRKRPFLPSSYPFLLPHVLFLLERAKHESTESSGYCPHKLLPAEIRQCFPVAPACTCLTLMGCIWLKLSLCCPSRCTSCMKPYSAGAPLPPPFLSWYRDLSPSSSYTNKVGGQPQGVSRGMESEQLLFPSLWSWILMPCLLF